MNFQFLKRGVVVLPTVLIIGVIIVGIVLTGVFVVTLLNRSNFGIRLAAEATAAARAGMDDFYLRLVKGQISDVYVCPTYSPYYTLGNLGRATANVYWCANQSACLTSSVGNCQFTAQVDGSSFFVKRKLLGTFDLDGVTGGVRVVSIETSLF